jgi:hypothetical protein
MANDLITELDRLHHRATDLRARERQLADAGENDPASDAWKTASILAASAESEFEIALVEAWPALSWQMRDADQWRAREGETQEALQAIGEEFGVRGGEPRVDGIRRVLTEQRDQLAALLREAGEGWNFDMGAVKRDETMLVAVAPTEANKNKSRAPFTTPAYVDASGAFCDSGTWRPVPGINGEFWRVYAHRPLPTPPAAGGKDGK